MGITNEKSGNRSFILSVALVCSVFAALLLRPGMNMAFSLVYLLVIVYLLWKEDKGKHYYFLGAIIPALIALGFFINTGTESKSPNLLYSNLMMVILVWIVIYCIYRQKKLVERMGKNNKQLSAMFENATEGILLVDDGGKILTLNRFAEDLFGYTKSELLRQPVEKLIPERYSHRHVEYRNAYLKDPHNRPMGSGMELYALHRDGVEFPVEVSLGYYTVEGSQTVIVFINDITERNKVRQQLILEKEFTQKLNEELEGRVRERTGKMEEALLNLETSNSILKETEKNLNKALSREKELGELKSRFVTMASHEFRTPLTTILSSVFLLENSKVEDQERIRKVHFERIRNSANNMTAILNDFLSLGKLEEGMVKPSYSLIDINALIEEVIGGLSTVKKSGQDISWSHSGSTEPQVVARQFLRNILVNLLSNAIKFSPLDGKIELHSEIENDQLKITVSDQGIGIPLDEQRHLFSRFFRARNAQNIDGTGLGLSIVNKYLDLMKGHIVLRSEANQGTTFVVTIPIPKNGFQKNE